MAASKPWWQGEGFRAALLSLILLGVILGVWHLATLPKAATGPALTPEQIEYLKLMGKDPAAQSGGGGSGFPTLSQMGEVVWTHVTDPFYDNGPNDKGIGIQLAHSLGRVALGFGLACLFAIPLGFVIGRWKRLPEAGLVWLQFFLIYVALPPLFYRLIADKPVTELANGRFILATTLSTFLVFMLSLAVGLRATRGDLPQAVMQGVAGSYSNIGYMGPPLLLAALGLAITYGLMGVINMAHGELMMIGAYATYVVQNLFRTHAPGFFDAYIWVALPASFLAAAAVGAVLERGVIRFLYGRPLETLLATWGISLVLMQAVRSVFGAQNVPVENPGWLSGGLALMPNLVLPFNRLAIIAFAGLVLLGVALLISQTRLGLFVRAVTQNRRMASCTGVNTARIDTWAFALGAGLAGLAGCALSQVGNVGPDLGQGYIVDAFMVVVLGGVGQLAGTVLAALGLGVLNKLLEDWAGAVLAKIMVLVFIVVFIQKRPQGLFALKGRSAEA